LNLKLVLFWQNIRLQLNSYQLQISLKEVTLMQLLMQLFVFVICVVFSGKFIIFNFSCFFVFLTYCMLSGTVIFSHFSFPYHGPWRYDRLRFHCSS
jgi:hypothetical protein